MRGDRARKRVTQQIRPVLATFTGVPPGVPGDDVIFLRQHQSVPGSLRVLLEVIQVPRVVVGEVITEHEPVAGPHVGTEDQCRTPTHQAASFRVRASRIGALPP